jgi:urease accessory protein UreE
MALTKTVEVDRIEVLQLGQLQVRTATIVVDDGAELARSFHRQVLNPGDDTTGQSDRVAAVAAATWTDAVVADWNAWVAEQEAARAAGQ